LPPAAAAAVASGGPAASGGHAASGGCRAETDTRVCRIAFLFSAKMQKDCRTFSSANVLVNVLKCPRHPGGV
jgi:hypothetical protein